MKLGLTLSALASKIEATARSARDFILPSPALTMTPNGELAFQTRGEGLLFPVNRIADAQLAQHCSIPKAYYDLCPAPLRAHNVNHWLSTQATDKRLIRVADGHVRAVLSNKYRPLDNYDLASHVLPIIASEGLTVMSAELTDTKLYLKCVNERVQADIQPNNHTINRTGGDIVQVGVIISNSEVGHGSLSVVPLIYRLICKNGLVVQDEAARKYHTGDRRKQDSDLDRALEIYCDDTRKKMDSALWAQVADMTRAAISEALFLQIVDKMKTSTEGDKVKAPEVACEVLRKRFALSEVESSGILGHLAAGGDLSRYGMLNAITRYAQDVESYDRSTELEKLGGNLLNMAETEWKGLASASRN